MSDLHILINWYRLRNLKTSLLALEWATVLLYSSRHTSRSILDFSLLETQCVSSLSLLCALLTAVSRRRMPPSCRSDGTSTLEDQLLFDGNISIHLNIWFLWFTLIPHIQRKDRCHVSMILTTTRHATSLNNRGKSGQYAASQTDTQLHASHRFVLLLPVFVFVLQLSGWWFCVFQRCFHVLSAHGLNFKSGQRCWAPIFTFWISKDKYCYQF